MFRDLGIMEVDMSEDYSILCESENERINLDEIVKSLFGASKKVLVRMMNSLFSEDLY